MKITVLIGSIQKEDAVANLLLENLLQNFKKEEYGILQVTPSMDVELAKKAIQVSDVLVVLTPLYLGGLPSGLLALLQSIAPSALQNLSLYCVVYEEEPQMQYLQLSMDCLQQWATKHHVRWVKGIGIARSNALSYMSSFQHFQKQWICESNTFLQDVERGGKDCFFSIPVPEKIYEWMEEHHWKKQIRAQGLHAKDLYAKDE